MGEAVVGRVGGVGSDILIGAKKVLALKYSRLVEACTMAYSLPLSSTSLNDVATDRYAVDPSIVPLIVTSPAPSWLTHLVRRACRRLKRRIVHRLAFRTTYMRSTVPVLASAIADEAGDPTSWVSPTWADLTAAACYATTVPERTITANELPPYRNPVHVLKFRLDRQSGDVGVNPNACACAAKSIR
jgi:hypothetical protein